MIKRFNILNYEIYISLDFCNTYFQFFKIIKIDT